MQISNVHVYGLENSIRVSKFPMSVKVDELDGRATERTYKLGCAKRGSGHDCFLKGIVVQMDLRFTNKAWVEAERYHWFDFVSSQSTMHCITKFDVRDQMCKYVDDRIIGVLEELVAAYNANKTAENYLRVLYNVPSGFELTAGMTTNYLQLKTIVGQRSEHRLPEWREFCKWVHTLPMFDELCENRQSNDEF